MPDFNLDIDKIGVQNNNPVGPTRARAAELGISDSIDMGGNKAANEVSVGEKAKRKKELQILMEQKIKEIENDIQQIQKQYGIALSDPRCAASKEYIENSIKEKQNELEEVKTQFAALIQNVENLPEEEYNKYFQSLFGMESDEYRMESEQNPDFKPKSPSLERISDVTNAYENSKYEDKTVSVAQDTVIENQTQRNDATREQQKTYEDSQGWITQGCSWFVEHCTLGTSGKDVLAALGKNEKDIQELQKVAQSGDEIAFQEKFRKMTGVNFNITNIMEAEVAHEEYIANQAICTLKDADELLSMEERYNINPNKITEETRYSMDFKEDFGCGEWYSGLEKALFCFYNDDEKACKKWIEDKTKELNLEGKSHKEKYNALVKHFHETAKISIEETEKELGYKIDYKTTKRAEKKALEAQKAAYGKSMSEEKFENYTKNVVLTRAAVDIGILIASGYGGALVAGNIARAAGATAETIQTVAEIGSIVGAGVSDFGKSLVESRTDKIESSWKDDLKRASREGIIGAVSFGIFAKTAKSVRAAFKLKPTTELGKTALQSVANAPAGYASGYFSGFTNALIDGNENPFLAGHEAGMGGAVAASVFPWLGYGIKSVTRPAIKSIQEWNNRRVAIQALKNEFLSTDDIKLRQFAEEHLNKFDLTESEIKEIRTQVARLHTDLSEAERLDVKLVEGRNRVFDRSMQILDCIRDKTSLPRDFVSATEKDCGTERVFKPIGLLTYPNSAEAAEASTTQATPKTAEPVVTPKPAEIIVTPKINGNAEGMQGVMGIVATPKANAPTVTSNPVIATQSTTVAPAFGGLTAKTSETVPSVNPVKVENSVENSAEMPYAEAATSNMETVVREAETETLENVTEPKVTDVEVPADTSKSEVLKDDKILKQVQNDSKSPIQDDVKPPVQDDEKLSIQDKNKMTIADKAEVPAQAATTETPTEPVDPAKTEVKPTETIVSEENTQTKINPTEESVATDETDNSKKSSFVGKLVQYGGFIRKSGRYIVKLVKSLPKAKAQAQSDMLNIPVTDNSDEKLYKLGEDLVKHVETSKENLKQKASYLKAKMVEETVKVLLSEDGETPQIVKKLEKGIIRQVHNITDEAGTDLLYAGNKISEIFEQFPNTKLSKYLGDFPERIATITDKMIESKDIADLFKLINSEIATPELKREIAIIAGRFEKIKGLIPDYENLSEIQKRQLQLEWTNIALAKFAQTFSGNPSVKGEIKEFLRNFTSNCPLTRTTDEAQDLVDKLYGKDKYKIQKACGAGTIGEAYLAKTQDGRDVIIKMLKKGMTPKRIEQDRQFMLNAIKEFHRNPIDRDFYSNIISGMFDAWEKELDFSLEAQGAENLAADAKRFRVAKPIETGSISGNTISIAMEKAEGIPLDKFLKMMDTYNRDPQQYSAEYASMFNEFPALENPQKIKRKISDSYQKALNEQQLFVSEAGTRTIHGDPHPGNIFINFDSKGEPIITFIDTGNVINNTNLEVAQRLALGLNSLIGNSKGIAEYVVGRAKIPAGVDRNELIDEFARQLDEKLYKAGINLSQKSYLQEVQEGIMKDLHIIMHPDDANFLKSALQRYETTSEISKICGSGSAHINEIDLIRAFWELYKIDKNTAWEIIKPILNWSYENMPQAIRTSYKLLLGLKGQKIN